MSLRLALHVESQKLFSASAVDFPGLNLNRASVNARDCETESRSCRIELVQYFYVLIGILMMVFYIFKHQS